MSICNALLTDDARPVQWSELEPYLAKLGLKHSRLLNKGADGVLVWGKQASLRSDDILLCWTDDQLTDVINEAVGEHPQASFLIDDLADQGAQLCGFSVFNDLTHTEDDIRELEDDEYSEDYIKVFKKTKVQIEVNLITEDGLSFVRKIAQIVAFVRGGIWTDSSTCEYVLAIKGEWVTPDFLEEES